MKRFDLKLAVAIAIIFVFIWFYQATAWPGEVIDQWEPTASGLVKIRMKGDPEDFWRLHIKKDERECAEIGVPLSANNELVVCTETEYKKYCYWLELIPIGTINKREEMKPLILKTHN